MLTFPILAMITAAILSGWLAWRALRMRPALWLSAGLALAGLAVFGYATRQGQDTAQSLPGVMMALAILFPAALAALIGGAVAGIFAGWRRK